MKIAFLLISQGIVDRGAELGTRMLAEDLAKKGYHVTYFQGGVKESGTYKIITIPIRSIADPTPINLLSKLISRLYLDIRSLKILWFSLRSLPQLLKLKPDILFPVDGWWQIIICKLAQVINGGKIVVSGKAGIGYHDRDALRLKPDLFVPISKSAAIWANKINPRQKVIYIPEQIDTTVFNPNVPPAKTRLKRPIVLTIAAFTKYKRIDAVIHAVAMTENTSLLIVGSGEEEGNLHQLAGELLPGRHEFKKATYKELPSIYTAADVFVLASQSQEAFGRVLIEALACGLPVVTINDSVRKSIVGNVGIFVNPADTQKFAKAIERALKSPPSTNNVRSQALHYDRQRITKMYETAFKELFEKN